MSGVELLKCRGYRIGKAAGLPGFDPGHLLDLLAKPGEPATGVLGGRGSVIFGHLEPLGSLAIKQYRRGGVFGRLIRSAHFGPGASRAEKEFSLLQKVRSLGGNVPEPVAFIKQGKLIYQTWLVMREIPARRNLTEFARAEQDQLDRLIDDVVREIRLLIDNGILHVDLHPGNVLVDADEKVHLLDFDKAREVSMPRRKLRDLYIFRWRRAVIKHRLPPIFSELFCLGLRRQEGSASAL